MREGMQFIRCKDKSFVAVEHVVRFSIVESVNPVKNDIARLVLTTGETVEAVYPFELRALPVSVVAGAQSEPLLLAGRDRAPRPQVDSDMRGGGDSCVLRLPRERAPA